MSILAKPNTFSPNTTISSSEVNNNFDTLYNDYNGSISAANLASSTITTAKIADSNVTTAKIADSAVTTAKLADGSITNAKLSTAAGEIGEAWTAWTPTWTNVAVSNSTVTGKYKKIGKTVKFRLSVVFAGGDKPSGTVSFSLPVTSATYAGTTTTQPIGMVDFYDNAGAIYQGMAVWTNTTTANIVVNNASATYLTQGNISATVPFTFGNGDEIHVQGFYEAA